MRSILKYTPLRQFSTNKVSQVIQQTAENLKQQQQNNYLKYEDIFFKLYTTHLQRQQKIALDVKKLDSLCMMGEFPCRSIVEHFHTTAKTYSEQYTVQTFVRLARAYKISQADNASTADYFINRLFFSPEFENLIEQYKYGLRKEHAMKWDNAFLVAECLIDIGYADYEVFSILVNMVETRLNKQQRNQTQIRTFQIQKRDYYLAKHRHTQQNLSSDAEFQNVLKLVSSHVRRFQLESKKSQNLKQLGKQLSANEQSKNIYHSIIESVSLIESYNQNITKLIEGIITIRKQYRKMTKLSESKDILRHPELNLELLELEEMLLMKKIISLSDIKAPERIENEDLELRRVEEILISMIEPTGQSLNPSDLSEFINTNLSEGQNKQTMKLNKLKEIAEYGRAMATLGRFAEISRRLYNSPDGRSLISMKWQKTMLSWTQGGNETTQWKENLHVEKIFRRAYADLYRMMKRSYSIFMFTFIEAPLRYKIEFFDSLTRLGFHDELIHLLEGEDFSKEKVETYSNSEFFSLIKMLNEVGSRINADHLKKSAVKHLKKRFEQSEQEQYKSLFSMQFCTNAVNFICQNFNVHSVDMTLQSKDEIQVLYENLINRLANQVKYLDESSNFLTNDHLVQALKVLEMERVGEFKLTNNIYARFGVDPSDQKQIKDFLYRKNPFNIIVQQLCDQYKTSPISDHHPFISTGFNAKGDLTAVMVCSSDQTSMDGKQVNGNTMAYIHRVKRQYNITIQPLAVNSFLEIDYDKLFEGKEFTFKSKEEIGQILSKLFKRDELHLLEFSQQLTNIAMILQKHYKRSYMYAFVKFLNTLNESVRLFDREKDILSFQLWRFRRYRLFVQLDQLKEDYNLIDKSVKEELQKMWKKESIIMKSQFFKKHGSILSVVEGIQELILNSIDSKNNNINFTRNLHEGKRFSIETFLDNEINNPNIGIEFINPSTYINKTFCPYNDWAGALKEVYPLDNVKLGESNNVIKILAKKFLPNVKEELTIMPFAKISTLKNKPQFHVNSLEPVPQSEKTEQKQTNFSLSQQQLQQVRQLMSFIHELKVSKSQEQLVEYIFSFDFINKLGQKTNEKNQHAVPLPRQHNSYFNYLQNANDKLYLESPNLEYLFNKLQQREQIQEIFGARKQRRAEVMIEYKLGNISRQQYIQKCEKVDDQIIAKLKTLSKNVLDNVDEYRFFQSGLKMVKIEKDQKQLERILNRARYYYRNLDKDFVHVRGNVDRCLKIKRNKAERTLALYNILYKIAKGENELTEHEKQVLKKQTQFITYRLENKKDHVEIFTEKFTHLTVGDLSKADKDRLRLRGSDLTRFGSLAVTDLILELVNLLDPKVGENFEKAIMKKYYCTVHKIPQEIFVSGLNKQFTKLAHEQQRAIINQKSKLDSYELNLLNEMIQTFKTESKTGKQRFAEIYGNFNEEIGQMNDSEIRVELISEYLSQKEIQYAEDYNPKLITQIKQNQVLKLWESLFKLPFDLTDSETIKQTVAKLCERIRLMGENTPPFFGLLVIKILSHPETDHLTKQNLLSNISYYKTPLKIDSEDVRQLGLSANNDQRKDLPSSRDLIEKLGEVSNKNFLEKLNKKINMII